MQELVQKTAADPCDEDLKLLSPVQTTASVSGRQEAAPKKQEVQKPRKPRMPAWKAEAIRKEVEFAKAYFSEVCNKTPRT
jgi:hypothetical protein